MLLIAMLTVHCSGTETDTSNGTADGATGAVEGIDNAGQEGMDDTGTASNVASDGAAFDPLYPGTRATPSSPAEERAMATGDMRGLRAILVADLEKVRARLNEGEAPEDQKKIDQALAADLAQGLERVDRALIALDASSDATWTSMRDSQLKEVDEVRAWMIDYRKDPAYRM